MPEELVRAEDLSKYRQVASHAVSTASFRAPTPSWWAVGLLHHGKNHNHECLVNIEIKIIQTIIFEFENVLHLFTMSLPKKTL